MKDFPNQYMLLLGDPNTGKSKITQTTMLTCEKKQPAFTDEDRMPFGKYKGERMMDMPPSYLSYMKDTLSPMRQPASETELNALTPHQFNTLKFYNYIFNSWEAIQQELGR